MFLFWLSRNKNVHLIHILQFYNFVLVDWLHFIYIYIILFLVSRKVKNTFYYLSLSFSNSPNISPKMFFIFSTSAKSCKSFSHLIQVNLIDKVFSLTKAFLFFLNFLFNPDVSKITIVLFPLWFFCILGRKRNKLLQSYFFIYIKQIQVLNVFSRTSSILISFTFTLTTLLKFFLKSMRIFSVSFI